ncbi:MAG: response regulator [Cyclobacteriaceae bacterium]|nr:response regulator [Cyclobacteriaceae bacterium]
MEKIVIVIIEDQREVLEAIARDLATFEDTFMIEECDSADEAGELMETLDSEGDYVALIISDHIMPGKSGVDFLIEMNEDPRFESTKKILLTGLATHQDTINAINNAAIDRYIEKPWNQTNLINYVKELITDYILKKGIDYTPYVHHLNQTTLLNKLRNNP